MRIPQPTASALAGIGALLVAGAFFIGCALADRALVAPAAPAHADEAARDAPPDSDDISSTALLTQNGTMRLSVPTGWSVADSSGEAQNYAGQQQWSNVLLLTAPDGTALRYYDGYGDAATARWLDFEVVEARETPSDHLAIAYWRQSTTGVSADVVLGWLGPGGQPMEHTMHDGIGRTHAMGIGSALETGSPRFTSVEEARSFLAGPGAQAALDVIATVELLPVPQYAMPEVTVLQTKEDPAP